MFLKSLETGGSAARQSGEAFALLLGRYVVTGWPKQNGYPDTEIDITAGQTLPVTLQASK